MTDGHSFDPIFLILVQNVVFMISDSREIIGAFGTKSTSIGQISVKAC